MPSTHLFLHVCSLFPFLFPLQKRLLDKQQDPASKKAKLSTMIAYKHSSVVPRDADVQNFRIFVGMLRICYTVYTTIDNHSCIRAYVYMYMHIYIWVPVTIATGMLLMVLIKGTGGDIRGSLIENHSCMVHVYTHVYCNLGTCYRSNRNATHIVG